MKKTFIMIAMGSLVAVSCVQNTPEATTLAGSTSAAGKQGASKHFGPRAEDIAKYDTDNDGSLSETEKKAMLLDRFDTNGNGVLDAGEVRKPRGGKRPS